MSHRRYGLPYGLTRAGDSGQAGGNGGSPTGRLPVRSKLPRGARAEPPMPDEPGTLPAWGDHAA